MTATVTRLPLTPARALAECRDLARLGDVDPALVAEQQMQRAVSRHDYQAARIYMHAHTVLTGGRTT